MSDSKRSKRHDVQCHTLSSPIHDCCFAKIDTGLFVSVPEFAFLQMASVLSIEKLILLGYEMCGAYCTVNSSGLSSNEFALTTPAKILRFAESSRPCKGRAKAIRACKHIVENSASPKESQLAMLLCLPYKLGGYNLPCPRMNHRIELSSEKQAILKKRFLVCDLYWPSGKVDIEYDSDEFHAVRERLIADARRRAMLESLGITSINVTSTQIHNALDFDDLARTTARLMHKKIRVPENFADHSLQLRREIGL